MAAQDKYPPARYAWYMVILLTIAYVFSFIDRYVLGLLIEPIKADLGFTDTQIGLLLGPAFAIFYATMGLPLGWLADRKRRTWIVAAGVAVWSLATAASGMAKNFTHMFIARMSVGIGEATLSPCAMSMISDSFPKENRAKPIAFYTMALSLGAAFASLLSASVLTWAKTTDELSLPLLGTVTSWQFTFIVVGLPGLILAVLFFLMREPGRIEQGNTHDGSEANLVDMFKFVLSRWKTFGTFLPIFCLMTIIAYSQGWGAPLFQRTWGWDAAQYAFVNAIVLLIVGPVTVNATGWLSDKMFSKGIKDAPLLLPIIGTYIMVITGVVAPLMPSPEWAFVFFGLNTAGIAMISATGVTALLNIVPGQIRAQTVAFYYMSISITGLLLGPTTVGLLTDNIFGEENLYIAMAVLPLIYGLPVMLIMPLSRRFYMQQYEQLEEELKRV